MITIRHRYCSLYSLYRGNEEKWKHVLSTCFAGAAVVRTLVQSGQNYSYPNPSERPLMNSSVEMFRDAAERKGRDRFACSLQIWDLLQEIGAEFGWSPSGSSYVALPGTKHVTPAGRDYQPGEIRDLKQVSEQDAMAWANALEAAILSPRLSEILMRRAPAAIPYHTLVSVVREFTEYCYGGAFAFSSEVRPDLEETLV